MTDAERGAEPRAPGARRELTSEQKRRMASSPGNAAAHRTVAIRRGVQIGTFALFVLFFLMTTTNSQHVGWVPKNLFMTLDFLNTLKNAVASHHIAVMALLPGLAVLVLTLWGGRIFCGWICPLGTTIDIADRLLYRPGRPFHQRRRSETRRYRNWKYLYLLAGLGAIVYGVDILTFGDPLSLITRTFALCLFAPVAYIVNGLLAGADHLGAARAIARATGLDLHVLHMQRMTYYNALPALLMFGGILGLSAFQERFWCRNLCPYGGLLALISRIGWLRHYVRMDGCIHCKKCETQSRMGCYENLAAGAANPVEHNIGECIQCFRCETVCPPDVIDIRPAAPAPLIRLSAIAREERRPEPERQAGIDLGRRRVMASIGAGLLWGAAVTSSAENYQGRMRRYPRNSKALRPPGALPEDQFLSACTRCAECMKVCPTNALQPAMLETGLEGIWTPLLVPAIGPCAEKCTACGDICPTHAIRPFTWQDKRYKIKLGLANVNQSTCVAWNGGRDCVVCAEVCPYSAVVFRDKWDDALQKDPTRPIGDPGNKGRLKRVPTVDEKLCTGCGLCEYHCPVLPDHSIVVYTSQEDREYREPSERPLDGLLRRDWVARKERGKDAEYAPARAEAARRIELTGPGAPPTPGTGQ